MSRFGNNGGFAQVTEREAARGTRYPGDAGVVGGLIRDSCPVAVQE
jgi:hypothetical protein